MSDEVFSIDRFRTRVGAIFRLIDQGAPPLELELASVTDLSRGELAARPARTPFSAIFHGPPEPVLPQRIYRLSDDELGELEIFIVPIGPEGDAMQYEAIFT